MRPVYKDREGYHFSVRYEKSLDYPLHLHRAVEIVFLTDGSCRVTNDGQSFLLEAGDVFFSFPNQIHGYEESRSICGYLLILPVSDWLQAYQNTLTSYLPVRPWLKKGQWEHTQLLQLVRQAHEDRNTVSRKVMQGYFQVIVGKLLDTMELEKRQAEAGEGVWSVMSYVQSHYQEPLTRSSIAQAVGYHESYISHFFSENLKMNLGKYIQSLRIEDALRLLEQTELSVAQIAAQTGFGSIRSFNRAFQDIMNTTPAMYRQQEKEK